ncbi:MAG: NUDIX domain-containing protein [Phycisphaerales bacterium]|nr:NUDIX domain-containing protein [Phycisphaerales bacterium]
MTARLIRLRRPAVLSMIDEPFVPDDAHLDEIDRRWATLCAENPAYFDGRVLHVLGVHRNGAGGAVLHVADCAYRFHATQDDDFDLGVRPLGVKGIVVRDGAALFGRRSMHVANYRGLWEFAPAGVVEPGRAPADVIVSELHEETGLRPRRDPVPVALLYDDVLRCWEMAFRLDVQPQGDPPPTGEYAELRWCRPEAIPDALTPIARAMRGLW